MNNSAKKTILYVITKSNFGGAQRYVFDVALSMHKNGHSVTVVAGGKGILLNKLEDSHIKTISLPFLERDIRIWQDIQTAWVLFSIYKKERPDIIHSNSSKIGAIGAVVGRIYRVWCRIKRTTIPKIIFTAHGWAFNENRSFLSKTIIYFIAWLTIILSDTTIAVSDAVKRNVISMPFISKKITVIKNGIDTIPFIQKEDAHLFFSKKIGQNFSDKTIIIGTTAELHPIKGLIYAIRACSILKKSGFSFLYIIMGTGDQKKYLENEITKNDLKNNVFMLGYVEDASKYLLGFDMFLLPSLSEGLPYVLLEARMANLPMIATNVGGTPEVIEDGISGILITPQNPQSISEAIKKITSDKDTYEKNLKEKLTNNFSLEKMAKETSALYM